MKRWRSRVWWVVPVLALLAFTLQAPPLPQGMEGTFHIGQVDAINLRINSQTWESSLDGCDNAGTLQGRVLRDGEGVFLVAHEGEGRTFQWFARQMGWYDGPTRVEVELVGDKLRVTGDTAQEH